MEEKSAVYKSCLSDEEISILKQKYNAQEDAMYDPLIEEIKMLDHKIETSPMVPCMGFVLFASILIGIGVGVFVNTGRFTHIHIAGILVAMMGFIIILFVPRFAHRIREANRKKFGPLVLSLLRKYQQRDNK